MFQVLRVMPRERHGQRWSLKRRKHSLSAPAVLQSPVKKRRKKWTNVQMEAAMKAVQDGSSGVNRAAVDYGVPCTTLSDRLSGRVKHNTNPGPTPYLSQDEEELGMCLKDCASVGYAKTRKDVMLIAETIAIDKRVLRKEHISHSWFCEFLKRQGDLSLRWGDNTAHIRMDSINSETMKQYYDLLEATLKENNLMDSPWTLQKNLECR